MKIPTSLYELIVARFLSFLDNHLHHSTNILGSEITWTVISNLYPVYPFEDVHSSVHTCLGLRGSHDFQDDQTSNSIEMKKLLSAAIELILERAETGDFLERNFQDITFYFSDSRQSQRQTLASTGNRIIDQVWTDAQTKPVQRRHHEG